jgi:hypothetical protein
LRTSRSSSKLNPAEQAKYAENFEAIFGKGGSAKKIAVITEEARTALMRLGLGEIQIAALAEGKSVAFTLSGAAEGTVAVSQLTPQGRLRVGIYTIKNEGGGLADFMTFEAKARAAAKALGANELEVLGVAINNARLKATLEAGGFTKTTLEIPAELGGGTTTDVISRVEPVK